MKKFILNLSDKFSLWLWSCVLLLVIIILIGGITRLTNSGLSITEWKPFIGIIPPLNIEAWLIEFKKYKQTPEYNLINFGMSLSEFKNIYLMEYLHRLLARAMGFLFLLPFMWFMYKKSFTRAEITTLLITFCFGVMQAFAGWYMVKSGLSKLPHVSHFMLSIHLTIAVIIISLLLVIIFTRLRKLPIFLKKFTLPLITLQILVFIQIILGSLLAGLDGGLIYNEFPLMGESFIPDEVEAINIFSSFSSPAVMQFMHRLMAYVITAVTAYIYYIYKTNTERKEKFIFKMLFFIVLSQILLGIVTLLLHVPVSFASLHQGIGILLHCIILYLNYSCYKNN
jgi:cytochrome c oxidase assembly protein subunit 15